MGEMARDTGRYKGRFRGRETVGGSQQWRQRGRDLRSGAEGETQNWYETQ